MLHFLGRHAWPFHEEVWSRFDRVARINGFYGVCFASSLPLANLGLTRLVQKSMLYVYDPKALHHILVKDQYVYEETPIFLKFSSRNFFKLQFHSCR